MNGCPRTCLTTILVNEFQYESEMKNDCWVLRKNNDRMVFIINWVPMSLLTNYLEAHNVNIQIFISKFNEWQKKLCE